MSFTIRPVVSADTLALSRICLLTGDAGQSAEPLHRHPELPGLAWALPYVLLPSEIAHTWGFVLVDDAVPDEDHTTKAIKGYIVGASDTRAYESATNLEWWPDLRVRFPLKSDGEKRTKADQKYIDLLHRGPDPALEACLAVSTAHMHINLLPEVQRRGWGRKLIGYAVNHLRGQGIGAVWLGIDKRNTAAMNFYEKLGFKGINGAPNNLMALELNTWNEPRIE
ncbi:acyl-CoA N-acyltransferase [Multifurca ochricompacta]|uniref:Acyl-CoA N-acyltransferase n=1 Tax=Multifurca ochricompacta TaxID=376703 RepID=A0AAD4MBY5_9AGAM|nr:acyl-CoA N-acyltransferase [Multifurca ochricompacta]